MSKNYYEILGVDKSASESDIKKSYKKLAMKYHPDRNKGDAAAEKKFKEVNEAYQTLSDSKKRAQYDQFGSADFSNFQNAYSGGNPFWWASWGFGGFSGWWAWGFDFSDIFSQFWWGGAHTSGSSFDINDLFGQQFSRQSSQSNTQKSEPKKESPNLDVTETVEIPFLDFLFDTSVSVTTVYGKHLTLKVKAFTKPGTKFKIASKGRTIDGKTGDMYVIVNAKMPKEIPEHTKKMIEAIRYEL